MLAQQGGLSLEGQQIKDLGTQEISELQQATVVSTIPLQTLQTGTFCSKDSADHSCANSRRRKALLERRFDFFHRSSFF